MHRDSDASAGVAVAGMVLASRPLVLQHWHLCYETGTGTPYTKRDRVVAIGSAWRRASEPNRD
ncbi:hypothetical protein GUJ93_ZPchr0001g30239, partial [Zizania palustris]